MASKITPARYERRHGRDHVEAGGVALAGEEDGEGTPVVLLHGLTATRRYVVMGSSALSATATA